MREKDILRMSIGSLFGHTSSAWHRGMPTLRIGASCGLREKRGTFDSFTKPNLEGNEIMSHELCPTGGKGVTFSLSKIGN